MAVRKKVDCRALPLGLTQEVDGFFYTLLRDQSVASRMEVVKLDTEPAMSIAMVAVVLPSVDAEKVGKEVYGVLTAILSKQFGRSVAVLSETRLTTPSSTTLPA